MVGLVVGLPRSEKKSGNEKKFKVREKSGNSNFGQRNIEKSQEF